MVKYYLNKNRQLNGDHEVHKLGCTYFPISNYEYLGEFSSCTNAVVEAKRRYPNLKINGCYYCSRYCHTS